MRRIQHLPRQAHIVTGFVERLHQFVQKRALASYRQTFHVLEHESASIELLNQAHELTHQRVTRVFQRPLSDHRKALTGRAAKHRSEEHTSELQSLMRISYAVFSLKKKQQVQTLNQPPNESHNHIPILQSQNHIHTHTIH